MTPNSNDMISGILREAFARRKKENKFFSFRLIAKKMDTSVSLISQIMNGKRSLTLEMIEDFSNVLDLDNDQYDELVKLIMNKKKVRASTGPLHLPDVKAPLTISTPVDWNAQPKQNFWVLQDWHYLAILDATYLADCDGTPAYFAKKLNLDLDVATEAIEEMLQDGLLEWKDGKLIKSANYNSFQSKANRADILSYHKSALKKSLEILETQSDEGQAEHRLVNSMTLTVPEDKVTWAKQQISQFLKAIAVELSQGPEEHVYQLSVQFVPLSVRE
ncbi:hypothetical protein AZI86_01040 [Bdellovibrio bacteriovorus]|uniref:HTH cro/C1-type domain-containing protein n=1 Tax=Bdellovibrio bacteriovorus TaxID=959 RepID=A0A150WMH6_BDEBC|nr:TIGR02147 family protein [Bdellovibrio bacteriovorus]KYG65691.1 hypothetical protein AZI86_01040 [Bdellovibrio bacteriovorus]